MKEFFRETGPQFTENGAAFICVASGSVNALANMSSHDPCTTTLKNRNRPSVCGSQCPKIFFPTTNSSKSTRPSRENPSRIFIRRYSSTEKELRETIAYLIRHREMMRGRFQRRDPGVFNLGDHPGRSEATRVFLP